MREWLKSIRKSKGLTEGNVAEEVGITQAAYHFIETGQRSPRPETAKRIGAVLGFAWTMFYDEEEPKSDNVDGNGQGARA